MPFCDYFIINIMTGLFLSVIEVNHFERKWRRLYLFYFFYSGLDDTGKVLIDTTNNDSPDKTIPGTASVEGLYVQFTSDDDQTNNGKGFRIDIIESSDMCKIFPL